MSKRLIVGIFLAVVASAITASAVVVVSQGGGSGEGEYGTLYIDAGPLTGNTTDSYGTIDACVGGLSVGTPFDIDIIIDGANDLAGPYWVLYYNKDVLKVTAYNWATWKMGSGGLNLTDALPDTDGAFSCTYAQTTGVNGAGVLLRLTLEPIADGSSDLKLCTAAGECPNAADSGGNDHPCPKVLVHEPAGEVRVEVGGSCPEATGGMESPTPVSSPAPAATTEASPYVEWTTVPPDKAVEEWVPEILPGTPVAGLALPLDYGRFHIRAPGTGIGPHVYAPGQPPPPGVERAGWDINTSRALDPSGLDQFRQHALFVEPPYIPAGWVLGSAHAEAVIWSDGSRRDTKFVVQYWRQGYFPIEIKRLLIAPDAQVQLVAVPASAGEGLTLGEIRGVPVVYDRDPLRVHFVVGNVVTRIESPLMHLDELIKIADALIAQTQEASP